MYLKSARLENWGCHDELTVDFHEEINVCVGRNGAGKSTLYHAIVAALTIKHSSKHADLSRFLSWGREGFGPTASIDIVRDDGVWNLEKTFLHAPRCLLKRVPGGPTPQSFNGAKAEQELDRWLESDGAAGRLILTLWSRQDSPIEYQEIPGVKSASLGTVLEKAIARAAQPEAEGPFAVMKKKFRDEYDARFTPEHKRIKTGSELHEAILRRDEARALRDDLRQNRDDLAEKVEQFRSRSSRHQDECRDRDELRRRKVEREQLGREYRVKAAALKLAEERASTLRAEHDSLRLGHESLSRAEADLAGSDAGLQVLAARLADALAARDEAERSLKAARRRFELARPLLDELINAFDRKRRVMEEVEALDGRRIAEVAARADTDRAKATLQEAGAKLARASEDSERATRSLAAARRSRLRRECLEADRAYEAADSLHRLALAAEHAGRRSKLRDRLEKVRALVLQIAETGGDEAPLPSDIERDALVAEHRALVNLESVIEADVLTARLVAEVDLKVRFSGNGRRELVAGESLDVRGVAALSIEIEGVGRIEIGRSSAEIADRLERLQHGREAMADRLATWGVPDVDELNRRLRRAKGRRESLERMALLLDGQDVEALEATLSGLDGDLQSLGVGPDDPPPASPVGPGLAALERRKNAAYLAAEKSRSASEIEPDHEPDDPAETIADPEVLQAGDEATRRAVEVATRQLRKAEIDQAKAEAGLAATIDRRAEAEARLAEETDGSAIEHYLFDLDSRILNFRADLEWVQAPHLGEETPVSARMTQHRLEDAIRIAQAEFDRAFDRWSSADAGCREADRARALHAATIERLRRTSDLELAPPARLDRLRDREVEAIGAEIEARLLRDAILPDPEADRESFEGLASQAEDRCHQGDIDLTSLRVEITSKGADGLDSRLAMAEERLERCESKVSRLQSDASAWALLHHLLVEVEADQSRDVARRLQALAAPRVSLLTEGSVGEAVFDPRNLAPASARVPGLASNPGLEQFSRGTREQVALACRLQIGLLLSEGRSRHVLLLDDPLAHTDPPRLKAALDMFASLRGKLQLIIFTCHEDRYRSMGDMARFHAIG